MASSSKEVSTMIKQGFISNPSITCSPLHKISPCSISSPSNSNHLTLSPPPIISRPTLFEMMSEEQLRESKHSCDTNRRRLHHKLNTSGLGVGLGVGDVKLTVSGRDGFKICMDVHRSVLADKSRFFAEKLSPDDGLTLSVEICDCDDVDVYVETLVLMYSHDLNLKLMPLSVNKVLALLKVSAAIMFEAGILSCLEHLEAVPWSEDEEQKVISCLTQLQLHHPVTADVLHRVSTQPSTFSTSDDIFLRMLNAVLQAKDDRARKEIKSLVSRLLKEDVPENTNYGPKIDVSRDTLYGLCHRCLSALILCLSEATCMDETKQDRGAIMAEIAREADNMHWIVDILIDKKMGDEFVKLWADQKELALLHSKIPTMYRHEISRVTAQLCIAIGKGYILVPKETRYALLSTWLEPLYEDFGWMKRACRFVDKKVVEDGLSQTILTLPLPQQQSILMNWFDRFLTKGDDCPNIQRAFEIWWRRAFIRHYVPDQDPSQLQITVCDYLD
ncbi:hypothetical protein KSS87_013153 [Heliosperma pusillum]|nr:hypothetical protein KSS87_013153 [Heliosperma pusillum]